VLARGAVAIEEVPGWGTLVQAHLPYAAPASAVPPPDGKSASPLTRRESEVLALLARGLTDREISASLVLSPKTVEKHVGAVLRKTGTSSRTAAVVTALERGWVEPAR
jgi:DNA-binding NarL/FixJ family response regulator